MSPSRLPEDFCVRSLVQPNIVPATSQLTIDIRSKPSIRASQSVSSPGRTLNLDTLVRSGPHALVLKCGPKLPEDVVSWPTTREQDQHDRQRHRVAMMVVGVVFAVTGGAILGFAGRMVDAGMGFGVVPMGLLLLVGGVVLAWRGHTTDTSPDEGLPRWEDLSADDPRKRRSLAARRRTWALGVALWVAGWAVAAGLTYIARDTPAAVRMVLFIVPSIGGVVLGSQHTRRHNGTDAFPDQ